MLMFQCQYSLLMHSVVEGCYDAFQLIIFRGGNASQATDPTTALIVLLLKRDYREWCQFALSGMDPVRGKAFINQTTGSGWSGLMAAAEHGHHEACRWALDHGALVNATMPGTGWTAMHAGAKSNYVKVIQVLLEAGGDAKLRASHRDFGRDLTPADVTKNKAVLDVLRLATD